MKNINKFEYRVISQVGDFEAFPLGEKNIEIDYTKDKEKVNYDKQLTGSILFKNEAFNRLMEIETSQNRCADLFIEINKVCSKGLVQIFLGRMSLNNAEIDLDRCEIRMQFEQHDQYSCIEDSEELNLFDFVDHDKVVRFTDTEGTFEEITIEYTRPTNPIPRGYTALEYAERIPPTYQNQGYIVSYFKSTHTKTNGVPSTEYIKKLARKVVVLPCTEYVPLNYVLAEDNCISDGSRTYYVPPTPLSKGFSINETEYGFEDNGTWIKEYETEIIGLNIQEFEMDNGMLLNDVLELLIDESCGLELQSDFFGINSENNSVNPITNEDSYTDKLILFQRSDVIRYQPEFENATIAEISISDLLEQLAVTFNIGYGIIDGVFRIEHEHFFRNQDTIDLTTDDFAKYINKKRKYTYDLEKLPNKEVWEFDKQNSPLWRFNTIEYQDCNTKNSDEKGYKVDGLTTDVINLISETEPSSNADDLKGFVLVATKETQTQNTYEVIRSNNVLSWFYLIQDFHYYNRPLKFGYFNGMQVEFQTTKHSIVGEVFSIPFCLCDFDSFNIFNTYKTYLGEGIVTGCKIDLSNEFMQLEISYEYDYLQKDSTRFMNPVIYPLNFILEYGLVLDDKIVVEDADGFIESIIVEEQAENGNVEIYKDGALWKHRYTHDIGYLGSDSFVLKAIDNHGLESNLGRYNVTIVESEQGGNYPKLRFEEFITYYPVNNAEYYVGNVLSNDIANSPLNELTIIDYRHVVSRRDEPIPQFRIEPNGDMYVTKTPNGQKFQFEYTAINDAGFEATQISRHKFYPPTR